MKQSVNNVNIEGIVSEINIRDIDKGDKKYITGDIVVKVPAADGTCNMIPVNFISADKKKDGTPNKVYASLQGLKSYNSIAALGDEKGATKVQIRGASLQENMFLPQGGQDVVTTVKINSNFFTRITNEANFKPEATFNATVFIAKMEDEVKNEEETGRLIVTGILIGYADKAEMVRFIAEEEQNVNFIKANWNVGDTVKIGGDLRFTEEVTEVEEEVGFGEAETKRYTRRIKEFIIKRGSAAGLDEEEAFNPDEVRQALMERSQRMEKVKNAPKVQPQATQNTNSSDDYGF